jgi:hypothetical protein
VMYRSIAEVIISMISGLVSSGISAIYSGEQVVILAKIKVISNDFSTFAMLP